MLIRYRVATTLDFQNVRYVVAFNTNGNGQTPLVPSINTFINYSFMLVFGGTAITGAAYELLQIIPNGSGFTAQGINIVPTLVTNFNPNSSGQNNEFTFSFNRLLLSPLQTTTPTPTPTSNPSAVPTLASGESSLWAINMFSASAGSDASYAPIDAIATNGVNDTTFTSFVVNTLKPFDVVVNKPNPPPVSVSPQTAQIVAAEVINAP